MSLSTSIVNSANAAYQTAAQASVQGLVWLKGSALVALDTATKAAVVARNFFAQALSQGYSTGKTYAAVVFQLAKANPFAAGITIGASTGVALTLLAAKLRAPEPRV